MLKISQFETPWKHWMIDNLIETSDFKLIQEELINSTVVFKKLHDDPDEIQFSVLPHLDLAKRLLSPEFKSYLENITSSQLEFYQPGAIQWRRMTPESPEFLPHVDYVDGPCLVMLYYVSPAWTKEKGGELILFENKDSTLNDPKTKGIEPQENRMVIFFNNTENWHSVQKVIDWTRYVVFAEWRVL